MRKLSTDKRALILSCLTEGNSINATARLCGCSKITVLRLLADAGTMCLALHDELVRGLQTERLQCDEIWSFVKMKQKRVPEELKNKSIIGDMWTWTAIDADTKVMVSWRIGDRTNATALDFMLDVAGRITSDRVQVTSDGYRHYHRVIAEAFGDSVDYAEARKVYGGADRTSNARYSPLVCVECIRKHIKGNPDDAHISTSYVERANLTMRMGMRRYTRLTNAFSKKVENHIYAVALHFFHYNFIRKHQTLKTTPAVAAGLENKAWTMLDLVKAIEAEEARIGGRLTDYLPAQTVADSK